MSSVIKIENLSKCYRIDRGIPSTEYKTLRETLTQLPRRFWAGQQKHTQEDFWALKGVSFEVEAGDSIGILGRNGAGKSTLLKLLSRITEPTSGRISMRGRVASLLEVGTGFHPELSGRENIFMNGAILGMSRSEIKGKFDEIVNFSGVEKFLDTPVKRYSSGMYVRLAFAIAAHLESEILIIDEVLAVGDREFQKRCLGKMEDATKHQGRTVLFVSHNMASIRSLCNKGLVLDCGSVAQSGHINEAVEFYLSESKRKGFESFDIPKLKITVRDISVNKHSRGQVNPLEAVVISLVIEATREIRNIGLQLVLMKEGVDGVLFHTNTKVTKNIDVCLQPGTNFWECRIDKFKLCSGTYILGFAIDEPYVQFYYVNHNVLTFEVLEVLLPGAQVSSVPSFGLCYLDHQWENSAMSTP